MDNDLFTTIKNIVEESFDWIDKGTVKFESNLKEDLKLDNHDIRDIVMELERIYGIELAVIMGKVVTIEDILNFAKEKIEELANDKDGDAEKVLKEITENP